MNMNQHQKLSNYSLNQFRILVRKALRLEKQEEEMFYAFPEDMWADIYRTNFNSDLPYAKNVILGSTEPFKHSQSVKLERVKRHIDNYDLALSTLSRYCDETKEDGSYRPIVFITDNDNDGSISQAIIGQLKRHYKNDKRDIRIVYAQNQHTKGFSVADIESTRIDSNSDFLVVTADNGINSRMEQQKFREKYPNATLLITDHHNPDPHFCVIEDEKTIVFNPRYFSLEFNANRPDFLKQRGIQSNKFRQEAYQFFREYNISGASTIGLLISAYLKNQRNPNLANLSLSEQYQLLSSNEYQHELFMIEKLSRLSNLLDLVHTAPADKPYNIKEIDNGNYLKNLLNTCLSMEKITVHPLSDLDCNALSKKGLNVESIKNSNHKLMSLNVVAEAILNQYQEYLTLNPSEQETWALIENKAYEPIEHIFNGNHIIGSKQNYISQLRPLIYELTTTSEKNNYQTDILKQMTQVFESVRQVEREVLETLRQVPLTQVITSSHSTIHLLDKEVGQILGRRLLSKAYNISNQGFLLNISDRNEQTLAGSFRSDYSIHDILPYSVRQEMNEQFGAEIQILGHDKAAGFYVRFHEKQTLAQQQVFLHELNDYIQLAILEEQARQVHPHLIITDLASLDLLSRINQVVRGNIPHFASITPYIQLNNQDMVLTHPQTHEQTLLSVQAEQKPFGWSNLPLQLGEQSLLISNTLLNHVVQQNFEPLLKVSFVSGKLAIANQVHHTQPENGLHLSVKQDDNAIQQALHQVYAHNHLSNPVLLSRDDIMDNPFFKYNRFGQKDFQHFENSVIEIIDSHKVDEFSVFDVEADGLGNARLINIGFMNYSINPHSGLKIQNDDGYFLSNDKTGYHYFIQKDDFSRLQQNQKILPANQFTTETTHIFSTESGQSFYIPEIKKLEECLWLRNQKKVEDGVLVNREIQANTFAFLVKPEDFIIPTAITHLTHIDNDLARTYGLTIPEIDQKITDYFKNQSTLFIAHVTNYDSNIVRSNLPQFSQVLADIKNLVADSAEFSKQQRLMYDSIDIVQFENIPALNHYYFYNNEQSSVSLSAFVFSDQEGEYPDIKNQIHLLKQKDKRQQWHFYVRDMESNIITKLDIPHFSLPELLDNQKNGLNDEHRLNRLPALVSKPMRLTDIGYNAQGLAEMKAVRQMLIDHEDFKVEKVQTYPESLQSVAPVLDKLQENYRFNLTLTQNLHDAQKYYPELERIEDQHDLAMVLQQFLNKNKHISNLYHDAWYHQAILKIYEPKQYSDLNHDMYDIVSSLSGFDKSVVEQVMNKAYLHQKKYGCSQVLPQETHLNGPYKGEYLGDIVFEDKATLLLLVDQSKRPFSNYLEVLKESFNRSQHDYNYHFLKNTLYAADKAVDSASFKQRKHFCVRDENSQTPTIIQMENRFQQVLDDNSHTLPIVSFKLGLDSMQDDKLVYAVRKQGVSLTESELEADAKKLAFVVNCLQFKKENFSHVVYDANLEILNQYKQELLAHYDYVEINSSKGMVASYLKDIEAFAAGEIDNEKLLKNNAINTKPRKNSASGLDFLESYHLENVHQLLHHMLMQTAYFNTPDPMVRREIEALAKHRVQHEDELKHRLSKELFRLNQQVQDIIEYPQDLKVSHFNTLEDQVNDYIELNKMGNLGNTNKIIEAMLYNARALNIKSFTPTRIQQFLAEPQTAQHHPLDIAETVFLSEEHSKIKRLKPLKHLLGMRNYLDLCTRYIVEQYQLQYQPEQAYTAHYSPKP